MTRAGRLPGPRAPWDQAISAWRLQRDPGEAMVKLHERYGQVCAVGAGPFRYVLLFGADATHDLFTADTDRYSWRALTKGLIPVDGETALIVSDGEDHRRRRRIVQPAFNIRRIDGHVPMMSEEAVRTISRWRPGDEVDLYQDLRAAVRRIVIRALFGERLSGQADDLGDRLQPALDFVALPTALQLHVGPRWRRARRARRETDQLVFSEIRERRRGRPGGDDVLSWLLESEDEGGLSDQEVRDQVVSLIAAGYETTSAAVGWTVWAALTYRGVWDRLRAEVQESLGAAPLTAEALRGLSFVDAVVNESLRLWPPGVAAGRQAVEPLDVGGFRIKAGTFVLYSPYVTHRLPGLWPDPLAFRPERWLRDAPGYAEPPSFAFLPFGAGPRRCIGFAFALTEVKALLAELVRGVDLELVSREDPGRTGLASMRPRRGVRAHVRAVRSAPVSAD